MLVCTDVLLSFARIRFPELAQVVLMPVTIQVALWIIGAYLRARGVVGIYLKADSVDGLAIAPIFRAFHCVENCVQVVWTFALSNL